MTSSIDFFVGALAASMSTGESGPAGRTATIRAMSQFFMSHRNPDRGTRAKPVGKLYEWTGLSAVATAHRTLR